MKQVLSNIRLKSAESKKMLAVLIDPDKCSSNYLERMLLTLQKASPDFIFVGGSQHRLPFDELISGLRQGVSVPIVLFPGDAAQFSDRADALLYLSLISGRNAEYLIGQHVSSAMQIYKSGIEVIPTAYMLIEGGVCSAVEYVSDTRPIPRTKNDITISTALAGQMLGMQLLYLEAGSGAILPVLPETITLVKKHISIPLIVGGGIKTAQQLIDAFAAGADLVVVGNALETNPELLSEFVGVVNKLNS